jgi:hypothetical protein
VINELTGHILFGDGRPILARCAQCTNVRKLPLM